METRLARNNKREFCPVPKNIEYLETVSLQEIANNERFKLPSRMVLGQLEGKVKSLFVKETYHSDWLVEVTT